MLGAGTVVNPLIKIVTTVAILAAVYLFIVKPVLDTTNTAFESFNDSFSGFADLPENAKNGIDDAVGDDSLAGNLKDCIQRVISSGADAERITRRAQRCADRFGS
jgi:hypothetical protein